ncbi:MAG: hypothetical protein WC227_03365 [Patescibacteria group bacterium]
MQNWIEEIANKIGVEFSRHPLTLLLLDQIKLVEESDCVHKDNLLETFEVFVSAEHDTAYMALDWLAEASEGECSEPECVQHASIMLVAIFTGKGSILNVLASGDKCLYTIKHFYEKNRRNKELKAFNRLCLAALRHAGVDFSQCLEIDESSWGFIKIAEAHKWIVDSSYYDRFEANTKKKPEGS